MVCCSTMRMSIWMMLSPTWVSACPQVFVPVIRPSSAFANPSTAVPMVLVISVAMEWLTEPHWFSRSVVCFFRSPMKPMPWI